MDLLLATPLLVMLVDKAIDNLPPRIRYPAIAIGIVLAAATLVVAGMTPARPRTDLANPEANDQTLVDDHEGADDTSEPATTTWHVTITAPPVTGVAAAAGAILAAKAVVGLIMLAIDAAPAPDTNAAAGAPTAVAPDAPRGDERPGPARVAPHETVLAKDADDGHTYWSREAAKRHPLVAAAKRQYRQRVRERVRARVAALKRR